MDVLANPAGTSRAPYHACFGPPSPPALDHNTAATLGDRPAVQLAAALVQVAENGSEESSGASVSNDGGMTLADFEQLARLHNPTLKQLAATTSKAAGYRTQVSLRPNPTVGYQGVQLADEGTDQHVAFVQQQLVTAGKLGLNRRVLNEAVRAQLQELEAQRFRVQTDVRMTFYKALAAQQRISLYEGFVDVTEQGLELAKLRRVAGEGSRIDEVQSKVQNDEIDLALRQARIEYRTAWDELVALTGDPDLKPVWLEGELPEQPEPLDWQAIEQQIVEASPEYAVASSRVAQARANLQRQGVQAIPNLHFQLGAGVDNATDSGLINIQVGAPIPVFNGNEGNISAAQAEYRRAMQERRRVRNSILARLAQVSKDLQSAAAAVDKYATEILPSTQDMLDLAETAYQAGETDFLQVLVIRRTFFEANLKYLAARTELAQSQAKLDGFVLSGGLQPIVDDSGDDSLRGLTLSQE